MTRCFGWCLPDTMLVPIADMLNHSDDGACHYMVKTDYEEDPENAHEHYNVKKEKFNFDFFNKKKMQLSEEEKEVCFGESKVKTVYIKKYIDLLSKQRRQQFEAGDYKRTDLKAMIREINLQLLKDDKESQIWNYYFYESSDSEDNDSSDGKA